MGNDRRLGFLGRFNVWTKQIGAFLLMSALTGVVGAVGFALAVKMAGATETISHQHVGSIALLSSVRADALKIRDHVLRHIITRDPARKRALEAGIEALEGDMAKNLAAYAAGNLNPEERRVLGDFREAWAGYRQGRRVVLSLSAGDRREEALAAAGEGVGGTRFAAALEAIDRLVSVNMTMVKRMDTAAERSAAVSKTVFLLVSVVAVGIGIAVGVVSSRAIALPLAEVTGAAVRVAAGDLSVGELPVRSADEIGRMTGAFNRMVRDLRRLMQEKDRLLEEEKENNITDSLTRARNHRYMRGLLAGAEPLPSAPGKQLAVMCVEIDHLKEIRTAFGHLASQTVLEHVGQLLTASVPAGSQVIRIDWDQFLVLLPAADDEEAVGVAERLCAALGDAVYVPTDVDTQLPCQVSASIGVAVGKNDVGNLQPLSQKADWAKDLAKGEGGNRVISAAQRLQFPGRGGSDHQQIAP